MTKETIKVYRRLAEQVLVTLRGHELARICDALDAADLRIKELEEKLKPVGYHDVDEFYKEDEPEKCKECGHKLA